MKNLLKRLILSWKFRAFRFKQEGKNCEYKSLRSVFNGAENISLGDNVYLGPGSELHGEGGIQIGHGVIFAPDVIVYTRTHNFDSDDLSALPFDDKILLKSVTIEDYVWIGRRAMIMPGIKIGKGAVIGAGAVVSKSIPEYGVAVGNPAKVVKYRDAEKFENLLKDDCIFVYEKHGHKKQMIQMDKE